MLAMDQFKDIRGFARYAGRLRVGMGGAIAAWLAAGFDETIRRASSAASWDRAASGARRAIRRSPRGIRAEPRAGYWPAIVFPAAADKLHPSADSR